MVTYQKSEFDKRVEHIMKTRSPTPAMLRFLDYAQLMRWDLIQSSATFEYVFSLTDEVSCAMIHLWIDMTVGVGGKACEAEINQWRDAYKMMGDNPDSLLRRRRKTNA